MESIDSRQFKWWAQQDSNLRPADYELPKSPFRLTVMDCYGMLQLATIKGFTLGDPSAALRSIATLCYRYLMVVGTIMGTAICTHTRLFPASDYKVRFLPESS